MLSPEAAARKRRFERWFRRAQLTQAELAAELGVSNSYIAMIVCGQRTPSLPRAKALAARTGFPITDFISSS